MRPIYRYLIFRGLCALALVITVLTTVFFIMRILPGDPVLVLAGAKIPESVRVRMQHELGLDQPLYMQYLTYIFGVFTGNYGVSWWTHENVWSMLMFYFPATIELVISAFIFAVVVGFVTGAIAAVRRDKVADHSLRAFSLFGVSLPIFWVAVMLQLFVGVELGWLPVAGQSDLLYTPQRVTGFLVLDSIIGWNYPALIDSLRHLILPASVLGLYVAGYISRLVRSNLVEALSQTYVVTARAKGLPERLVIYKHALRNAMIPVMTVMIYQLGWFMGGSVVTELVFAWPGIGYLYYQAVLVRDFQIIQGYCGFNAILLGILLFAMDASTAYFDPRVKTGV